MVRDEGPGFDPSSLPDPESEEALYQENGRGIFLITKYMHSLEYFEGGRAALLFERCQ